MLPTHSQPRLGEEKLVPGLGDGDINHRKHLSGWHLELKENTWPGAGLLTSGSGSLQTTTAMLGSQDF